MLGKALATFVFTLTALVVQLLAFKVMFELAAAGEYGIKISPDLGAFVGVALLCLPLIDFAVGLQIIVATVSRSCKETQTYLGLLPLLPSLHGKTPQADCPCSNDRNHQPDQCLSSSPPKRDVIF